MEKASYSHPVIDVASKLQPTMILLRLRFPRSALVSTDILLRKRPRLPLPRREILSSNQLLCARLSSAAFLIVTMQSMRSYWRQRGVTECWSNGPHVVASAVLSG